MVKEFQVLVGEQHLVVGNTAECEHGGFADENVRLFILKTNIKKNPGISRDILK